LPTEGVLNPNKLQKASACEALSGEARAALLTEGVLNPNKLQKASACEALSGEARAALPTEGVLNPNKLQDNIYDDQCGCDHRQQGDP
jgi:hypothetical protein